MMNAANIPPRVLDTMLDILARECAQYRHRLGDFNIERHEVLMEAYVDAMERHDMKPVIDGTTWKPIAP